MHGPTEWAPAVWRETFEDMLDDELDNDDMWTLNFNYKQTDTVTPEEKRRGWKVYCYNGFGSFQCNSCSKVWASAKVTIVFRYRLLKGRGTVIMRPFGQTCRDCHCSHFELPGFSEDDVEGAVGRVFNKIRVKCYGEEDDNNAYDKGNTKRTKPHEASLCEACSEGICRISKNED